MGKSSKFMGKTDIQEVVAGLSNIPTLAERLKKLRGGRTLEEIYDLTGIPKQSWSRYEGGQDPKLKTLQKIAKAFNLTVEELTSDRRSFFDVKVVIAKTVKEAKISETRDVIALPRTKEFAHLAGTVCVITPDGAKHFVFVTKEETLIVEYNEIEVWKK